MGREEHEASFYFPGVLLSQKLIAQKKRLKPVTALRILLIGITER
jgi:hypothetical protein